jgi:hypothetical protein
MFLHAPFPSPLGRGRPEPTRSHALESVRGRTKGRVLPLGVNSSASPSPQASLPNESGRSALGRGRRALQKLTKKTKNFATVPDHGRPYPSLLDIACARSSSSRNIFCGRSLDTPGQAWTGLDTLGRSKGDLGRRVLWRWREGSSVGAQVQKGGFRVVGFSGSGSWFWFHKSQKVRMMTVRGFFGPASIFLCDKSSRTRYSSVRWGCRRRVPRLSTLPHLSKLYL